MWSAAVPGCEGWCLIGRRYAHSEATVFDFSDHPIFLRCLLIPSVSKKAMAWLHVVQENLCLRNISSASRCCMPRSSSNSLSCSVLVVLEKTLIISSLKERL